MCTVLRIKVAITNKPSIKNQKLKKKFEAATNHKRNY